MPNRYLALANLALRDDRHVGDIVISGGIEVILDSLSHMEEEANVQARGGKKFTISQLLSASCLSVSVCLLGLVCVLRVCVGPLGARRRSDGLQTDQ